MRAHRSPRLRLPVADLAELQAEILDPEADARTILRRAAELTGTLASADAALLELVADDSSLALAAGAGSSVATQALRSGAADDLARTAMVRGTPAVCDDAWNDPRFDSGRWRRLGMRSVACVPFRFHDTKLGVLTAAIARPRAFDESRLMVLSILAGQVSAAIARCRLVAELREADHRRGEALAANDAWVHRIFMEVPLPMWVLDAQTRGFLSVNEAASEKYGYSAEEFARITIDAIRPDARLRSDFENAQVNRSQFAARHRLRDGRAIDVEVTTAPMEFAGRQGILSIINDVTERNRLERELSEGIFRDPLTGGPNRALFTERVGHALARTRRHSNAIAVLYIDLDNFKAVNDSMGYVAGDALLQAVAARLAVTLRPGDTVARLSADEFAVLLEDIGEPHGAADVAERLLEAFSTPVDFDSGRLSIGLSIGVADSSTSGPEVAELLRDAELAMRAAKDAGRGRVEVFTPRMHASAVNRLSIEQDLRQAVDRGELRLLFQPFFSVDTGAIVGCEALVRWQHPKRGLVPPDSFIPLAEETGLIASIDTWVLRTACAQMAAWHDAGHANLVVAVNVSARELGRADLVDRVEAALFESGLPPYRLEIEITESAAAAQPAETLEELRQLRRAGISIAIDDFGTGYSSLSQLATYPVDRIKIDRSFLHALRGGAKEEPLVAAMIGIAHTLGLEATAEGVETPEQLAFLRRHGCDLLQGYLFSRPVDARAFEELLAGPPQQARAS